MFVFFQGGLICISAQSRVGHCPVLTLLRVRGKEFGARFCADVDAGSKQAAAQSRAGDEHHVRGRCLREEQVSGVTSKVSHCQCDLFLSIIIL